MAIPGFDYELFAKQLAEQAVELVPPEMNDREKEYIVKTLGDFTYKTGKSLSEDTSLNINADQASFISQVIAEWSYHKSIDLIHSGILPEFWDSIMQKIAFTIYEIAKQAILRNVPQDQLLQAIEHQVVKVYNSCIEELQQKGVIDEEVKNRAESQSNIDTITQQANEEYLRQQEEAKHPKRKPTPTPQSPQAPQSGQGVTHKQMKLMTLAMVLKILSQDKITTILNKFDPNDSQVISQYMGMADLESHLDSDLISGCIKEIREYLPIKRKLTKENVLADLLRLYKTTPREKIEKVLKNERPLVKRFVAQAYEGEYSGLPLKVAGIVAQYVEDSV